MVNKNSLKIGDLTIIDSQKYKNSLAYKSPELHYFYYNSLINVTNKTDIWSIGIIFYEIIKLDIPFKNIQQVLNDDIPDIGQDKSDHFKDLLKM